MADRRTLEDKLRDELTGAARAKAIAARHECENCGRSCRAFEIVDVSDVPGIDTDMACTRCLLDDRRSERDVAERKARKTLPPWQTPEGHELKAYRDRYLDKWRWTVARDSPLSATCQEAWLNHLHEWHRMAVDAPTPADWTDPPQPALDYAPTMATPKGRKG